MSPSLVRDTCDPDAMAELLLLYCSIPNARPETNAWETLFAPHHFPPQLQEEVRSKLGKGTSRTSCRPRRMAPSESIASFELTRMAFDRTHQGDPIDQVATCIPLRSSAACQGATQANVTGAHQHKS